MTFVILGNERSRFRLSFNGLHLNDDHSFASDEVNPVCFFSLKHFGHLSQLY